MHTRSAQGVIQLHSSGLALACGANDRQLKTRVFRIQSFSTR
jgi:hypothetical protein